MHARFLALPAGTGEAWTSTSTLRAAPEKPRVGQLPVCFDLDRDAAVKRAHENFRWFGSGWKVNAELPGPSAFDAASQFVRPEDVATSIPCGDDPDAIAEALRPFVDAGFIHVALVQESLTYAEGPPTGFGRRPLVRSSVRSSPIRAGSRSAVGTRCTATPA